MYLPYLRGKQYELLALRDFAEKNVGNNSVTPIIEPVRSTFSSMTIAVNKLLECNIKFAMVLNPQDGDFKHIRPNIIEGLPMLEDNRVGWIPAYIYRKGEAPTIKADIENIHSDKAMIIFREDMNLMDGDVLQLLDCDKVQYVIDGKLTRRKIRRFRGDYPQKDVIRLDDSFRSQSPSTLYADNPDESFSEAYLDYQDDELYGFADYTALSRDFSEGGMLPAAVVIHLTYVGEDEIRIHHFVSESNNRMTSVQQKFMEAACKVRDFYKTKPRTSAVDDIEKLVNEERYPGLGYLKKLSIVNHLELINRLLSE